MRWISVLFILAGFRGQALVQEPSHCLRGAQRICLAKTQHRSEAITWKENIIWLSQESMVELSAEGIRILQGHVWVQAKEEFPFQTAFVAGTVKGDLWLHQDLQRTLVRHLSGDLFLRMKSNSKEVILPVGFENWYSGIQSDKEVYQGVLRPMPSAVTLGEWLRQFRIPQKIAGQHWENWADAWSGNVEMGSAIYQKSIQRHIASIREREARERKLQAEHQVESKRMREMFRLKNGIDSSGRPSEGPNSQDF